MLVLSYHRLVLVVFIAENFSSCFWDYHGFRRAPITTCKIHEQNMWPSVLIKSSWCELMIVHVSLRIALFNKVAHSIDDTRIFTHSNSLQLLNCKICAASQRSNTAQNYWESCSEHAQMPSWILCGFTWNVSSRELSSFFHAHYRFISCEQDEYFVEWKVTDKRNLSYL